MTTDLLTTLRRGDPAPDATYDDDTYDGARLRALAEALRTEARPRARRRLLIALPVAAAVAVGIAVVPTLLGGPTGATAEAATLLDAAADAIGGSDPAARPDQYWQVETTATVLAQSFARTGYGAALIGRTTTTYVAVDGARATYVAYGAGRTVEQLAGTSADTDPGGPSTLRFDAPNDLPTGWPQPTPAFLAALPRDPADLEARLRADTEGAGRSADGAVFVAVADVLRTGLVPADLRRALYRVLANVPGVQVVDRTASIGDGTGVAFARDETTDGSRQEIVVDTATGALVGEREVLVDGDAYVPAGTVMNESTTSRRVVDAVPPEVVAAAG